MQIGELDSFLVNDLAAASSECYGRALTRSAGSSFTIIVDADAAVDEVDESNNQLTGRVSWPTIMATCTATRTRTPTPPASVAEPKATAGPSTTWMTLIPCRQCGNCDLSAHERIGLITGNLSMDRFIPDGVDVLDQSVGSVGVVCAACDCPQTGSPIFEALVALDAVEAMRAFGWIAHR